MPTESAGFLGRLGRRLTETLERADASELERLSGEQGADKAAKCRVGEIVELIGRIRSVTYGSEESELGVRAEIFDGTAPVHAVWLGRRAIPGIEVGRYITVRGRLAAHAEGRAIYNPRYELREASAGPVRESAIRER